MLEALMARQPIFDRKLNVVAYELLFRKDDLEKANIYDGNKATADVFMKALVVVGVNKLSDGKKVFVNFTKQLIMEDVPSMMSPDHLVVEILEDIQSDKMFLNMCVDLKQRGYVLALDDFVVDEADEEIAKVVDVIKIDFMGNTKEQRRHIIEKYRNMNVKFLGEKIETAEEYQEAMEMGYSYFQGYFFSKPSIIKGKDIVSFPVTYIKVLEELEVKEPNYSILADAIETDIAITYKLLRLINSPVFYTSQKIESIQQALVLLGLKEIKKWISLLLLRNVGKDKPDEILKVSLIRAKMGESLSQEFGLQSRKSSVFLMCMFSMADVLTGRDMKVALNELPLEEDVKDALLGVENAISVLLKFVVLYEKGDWDNILSLAKKYNIPIHKISDAYVESVDWVSKTVEI